MQDTQTAHHETLTRIAELVRRDVCPILSATSADGSFRAHDALATGCTAAHIESQRMTAAFFAIDEQLVRFAARAHGLPEPTTTQVGEVLAALWGQRVRLCASMIAGHLAAARR